MRVKIICLNIEKNKHLPRIISFLQKKKPDVIFLQEIFLDDVPFLEKELAMKGTFAVMKILQYQKEQKPLGIVTFSALPLMRSYKRYFYGDGANPPLSPEGEPLKTARAILVTEFLKEKETYCFINTHFTWTPDGQDSAQQHQDLENLFHLLSPIPEFLLCGDFNAPRGGIIFGKIAQKYKDNMPSHITTTLDKTLHRAGDLQLVVDGVFTTPKYTVDSLELFGGLSDHCAILATVSLKRH